MLQQYRDGDTRNVNGTTYVRQGGQWRPQVASTTVSPEPVVPDRPPAQTDAGRRIDELTVQVREQELRQRTRENEAAETAAARNQTRLRNVRGEIQRVIDAAERAKRRSREGWFQTGIGADWIGSNTAEGRALRGDLTVIGSNVAFNRLQQMREESPTGGALGAITERELQLLQNTVASLDPGQSDADFQRSMDTIIQNYQRVMERLPPDPNARPQPSFVADTMRNAAMGGVRAVEGAQRNAPPPGSTPGSPSGPARPPAGGTERPEGTPVFFDEPTPPEPPPLPEGFEAFRETLQAAINRRDITNYDELLAAARQLNPAFAPSVESVREGYERAFEVLRRNPNAIIDIYTSQRRPDVIGDARGPQRQAGLDDLALAGVGGMEPVDAAVRGTADIVTVGGGDEIAAIGDTIFSGGTLGDNLYRQRAIDDYDMREHPYARGGGQILGALVLPSRVPQSAFQSAGRAYASGLRGTALRSAARQGALRRMAGEGAVFGGAYGFGSSRGDLSDRLTSGATSAVVGAATAYGLGAGGNAILNRISARGPTPRDLERVETAQTAQAAADRGMDMLPADVGGPFLKKVTAGAAQLPFASGPIIRRAQELERRGGEVLEEVATASGAPARQEVLGETAQRAANEYIDQSGAAGKELYTEARELSHDTLVTGGRAFRNLNAQLRELQSTSDIEGPLIDALTRFRNVIAGDNGLIHLDVDAIRRLRTAVATEARSEGLRGSDYKRRAGLVLDDLREDIASQLPAAAAASFRRADDAWRKRLDTIDTVIEEVIGPAGDRSAERVAQRLINMASSDSQRFTRFLRDVPAEDAGVIRGSVIQELGRARSGQQNAVGPNAVGNRFSLDTFLTNWDRLPERTRSFLFNKSQRSALNDLARTASLARESRRYANTSNTGGAVNISEKARALSYLAGWTTLGGTIVAEYVTGRMLASPVFTRWLARTPRTAAERSREIARLADIARTQPAIANDVLGLQRALLNSGTVSRAAASPETEGDQQ